MQTQPKDSGNGQVTVDVTETGRQPANRSRDTAMCTRALTRETKGSPGNRLPAGILGTAVTGAAATDLSVGRGKGMLEVPSSEMQQHHPTGGFLPCGTQGAKRQRCWRWGAMVRSVGDELRRDRGPASDQAIEAAWPVAVRGANGKRHARRLRLSAAAKSNGAGQARPVSTTALRLRRAGCTCRCNAHWVVCPCSLAGGTTGWRAAVARSRSSGRPGRRRCAPWPGRPRRRRAACR